MKNFIPFLFVLVPFVLLGQQDTVDTKYLEDQFYVGLTYNIVLDRPENINQRNLSYGVQGGFIKDIPVNSARNVAFGLGLGYAANSYYTNLLATETDVGIQYSRLDAESSINRNKVETHLVEMPIEFRWRNSTPSEHRFWRIYTGMKLSYLIAARSKAATRTEKVTFDNTDVRKFHYGVMINVGFNTFNFHAYYSLSDLFEEGTNTVNGAAVTFRPLRVGIIFYIL